MTANTVTYFGDVTTVGNTIVFQNLTSQGNYSIFSGNVNPAVTGTTSVGTAGVIFTSNSNTATLNVTSLYGTLGLVGLNGTGGGATLNVAGNTWTSNALSTQNVFAATGANVVTLNTAFITGPLGFVGIGTTASGASLNVYGNFWASNALAAQNVFATTSANAVSLNTASIFGTAGRVGINTTAYGATLNVAGNVWVSNAIGATNVFATSFANVTDLITSRIVSTTGFVGLNCTGGGATLNVDGNVWASNALAAQNVFATVNANVVSLNTKAIFSSTGFVGINTTGGGTRLNVLGNVLISNALTTTNVLPTMNANIVTTNVTYMNLFTAGLGINGPAQAGIVEPFFIGGTLSGDAAPVNDAPTSILALKFSTSSTSYVNYGLTSPAHININTTSIFVEAWIYATTTTGLINVASYGRGSTTGWYMQVRPDAGGLGDGLYVGNSQKDLQAVGTFAANQWTYVAFQINGGGNDSRIYGWISTGATTGASFNTTNGGPASYSAADPFYLGAVNGVGGLASGTLYIRDMRIISGAAITLTGSFTQAQAPFAAAVPSYVTGTGLAYNWGLQASSNLYQAQSYLVKVAGNVLCSNAFQGGGIFTNVLAVTSNLGPSATKCIFSPAAGGIVGIGQYPVVGSATLQVTGNIFASNALQSPSIIPSTSANATSSNIRTITNSTLRIGVGKGAPTANLDVLGNAFASNALQSSNITVSTSANSMFTNVTSNNLGSSFGINKVSPSSNLDVAGNTLITNTLTATGIDQQLPVLGFTGTGTAGAYTNVANGVTFTVGATSETSTHEAWRAMSFSNVLSSMPTGASTQQNSSTPAIPSIRKFQLYEGESIVTYNQLWSPNGRYVLALQPDYNFLLWEAYGNPVAPFAFSYTGLNSLLVTRLTLTTIGFLHGYNAAGTVVYTSPNTATGYGPYRLAVENAGYFAIYDRYNTILWQSNIPPAGWQTSGTIGGDTVQSLGGYRIHTFTTVGAQKFVIPNYLASLSCDYLIVAGGGGGGGGYNGGGGGGGGLIAASTVSLANGVYTVTVGAGGAGMVPGTSLPTNGGSSSVINSIGGTALATPTAVGGGAGGCESSLAVGQVVAGQNGGSGGGGSWPTLTAGTGTAGQGFAGGTAFNGANYTGAGGGGAGGVGTNSTSTDGGTGGLGVSSSITTVSNDYSGGGGGSARGVPVYVGGGGSSGGLGYGDGDGLSGQYYGGGGGAGGGAADGGKGGAGYQGIVIIRYLISSVAVSNAWGFSTIPQTLTFRMPTMYIPTSLLIQGVDYNNSAKSANAFTFSGSTDGTNYKTLTSNTTYLSNTDYGYNIYSITTNTAWNYFQLTVTGAEATPGYVNQMIINGQISWSPTANSVTTNVGTSNIFTIADNVGIGTSTGGGATIQVLGNVYASNALMGTIRSPLANVTTSNIQTISGQVGINTSTGLGANIHVLGNVYASNALFGTIRSPLANTQTLNTSILYGTSGLVGFNVTPVAGGPTLQFGSGNLYASNAISGQNVIVTTIQTYNEDLTRRSPHLRPTTANATAIQNWISASSNMTQRSGWSTTASPTCSNVIAGPLGSSDYTGSVLLPDGRVLFVPASATNIGFYRPSTMEFSTLSGLGLNSTAAKYSGGVLLPNGNVFFTPSASANIGIFNPVSSVLSNIGPISSAAQKFGGAVLAGNGTVIMIPYQTSNIGLFNPATGVYSNGVAHTAGAGAYLGGVLAPTGNVVLVPFNSSNVGMYDPVNATWANVAQTTRVAAGARYLNGCIAQNGNIIFSQWSSANVGSFNPVTFAFSNLTTTGAASFTGAKLLPEGNVVFVPTLAGANVVIFNPVNSQSSNVRSAGGFGGASLLPNGSLVFVPAATNNVVVLNTLTPTSREFCLSPYVNSF